MVGRDAELRRLRATLAAVESERRCRLVTVLGPAGVGKSCLVRTCLTEAEGGAAVVVGRCLSYGEGITFWALREIVQGLAGRADEAAITALVGDDEDGRWVAARVAQALGMAAGSAPIEEIQLAVRRLLESAAHRRPLIVVVDDIHWAEPTLLDVLEHIAAHARDVPLLLVCMARPDLLTRRPSWSPEDRVFLSPLTDADSARLLERLDPGAALDARARAQLLATAEGNPLFLEQMVAMRQEAGSEATIPSTVQAVLAARIDALEPIERAVIDCAAVEGREFHRGVVRDLVVPEQRATLDVALAALVERDLIRRGRAGLTGEEGYRFAHILIREAVYALLPKARRAQLHERFGRWLEHRPAGDRDLSEIIGYHFEQAHRCSTDLEPGRGTEHRPLAQAAARHLGAVGHAALAHGDVPAAVKLLERARDLLEDDEPPLGWLLPELGTALTQAGRLTDAERVLEGAVQRAAQQGDPVDEAHARVCLLFARLRLDTGPAAEEVLRRFGELRATFSRDGDDLGLGRLWRLRALVHWLQARSGEAEAAWQVAVEHAGRAGDEEGRADALCWLASSAFLGPMPAAEGIAGCEALRAELRGNPQAEAFVLQPLAGLWAMCGEAATARELLARSNAMLADLGVTMLTAFRYYEAFVELLADDPAGAEASLRDGYLWLQQSGEKALHADTVVMLARALHDQGRLDEALELTREAEAEADADDLAPQFGWRAIRAAILARRGELGEARRLADEAVTLVERTDWVRDQADILMTRAEVQAAGGDGAAARETMLAALARYEEKGSVVDADRVRAKLTSGSEGVRGWPESTRG
jgi:tetratricopeptide (TPR) repeat protein